jgi:hypothetical protein
MAIKHHKRATLSAGRIPDCRMTEEEFERVRQIIMTRGFARLLDDYSGCRMTEEFERVRRTIHS